MQLYADGVAVEGALSTLTVASGDTYTFTINDVVRTVPSFNNYADLTIQFNQPVTIVGGDFIVEYVR